MGQHEQHLQFVILEAGEPLYLALALRVFSLHVEGVQVVGAVFGGLFDGELDVEGDCWVVAFERYFGLSAEVEVKY